MKRGPPLVIHVMFSLSHQQASPRKSSVLKGEMQGGPKYQDSLQRELSLGDASIVKLKDETQRELEMMDIYRSNLRQLQRKERFIQMEEEMGNDEEERTLESLNPLIAREIEALREQIQEQARDSQILRSTRPRKYDEQHESIPNLTSNIQKMQQKIDKIQFEMHELRESKSRLKQSIKDEQSKYMEMNGRILRLLDTEEDLIYREGHAERNPHLLMEDCLRYGASLRRALQKQRPKNSSSSSITRGGELSMEQIPPLLRAMQAYNKGGERSFLFKLMGSLLEAWELKEVLCEKEKRVYKTLGQRWIVLSKFTGESNVVFEGVAPPPHSSNNPLEVECKQPNLEEDSGQSVIVVQGHKSSRKRHPKIL